MDTTFGDKIKNARKIKGLTQRQLADSIGAKHNSVSDWENNKNKPDPDTIELICGVLDITPNYLMATTGEDVSPADKLMLKKYHSLSEHSKELVDIVLNKEYEHSQYLASMTSLLPMRLISYYYKNASAGNGQLIYDDLPDKSIEIPDIPEYRDVSYAIRVNGSSMEPELSDGDVLLIEATQEIRLGQIGIFSVDGECFVKMVGETELISLNSDYPNIPLNETSRCLGRVIGKM